MSASELKIRLISRITKISDIKLLEEIDRLLHPGGVEDEGDVIVLSKEQKDLLAKSISQIEQGNYLTDQEADKDIKAWLED